VRQVVLGAALALAACDQGGTPSGKPLVVTSFYPLLDFTRRIAGSAARVVTLVPPGVEPHDWEPSPRDLTAFREARLFVYNGAGLEPWVPKLLQEASTAAPGPIAVRATEGIQLRSASGSTGGRDAAADPHVWLDPVLARSMADVILAGLVKVDPAHSALFSDNARALEAQLTRLDEAFASGLRDCARREIITSHSAFGYLAARYRLDVVPVMSLAPEAEPTPAHLASVIQFAREHKVKYIFFETLVNTRLADTLAREVGVQTLVLNPIEGVTADEEAAGKDYFALMEQNLANLRRALDCR
jgi:zinc transport system substrate-binding protein